MSFPVRHASDFLHSLQVLLNLDFGANGNSHMPQGRVGSVLDRLPNTKGLTAFTRLIKRQYEMDFYTISVYDCESH